MHSDQGPPEGMAVLDSVPDAVFAVDADWRFTYANAQAEAVLGRMREELAGRALWDELPDLVGTPFADNFERAMRDRSSVSFEAIYPALDAWVYTRAVPCGRGLTIVIQDFGQRKELERERAKVALEMAVVKRRVHEISRMKDEFLSMLSHELRTPLGAGIGWIQLLRSGRLDEAGRERGLDVIERNMRSQAQLIKDLLDISRIARGKMRLDVKRVDAKAILDAAFESVRPAVDAKRIRVERNDTSEATLVLGDAERLQQLFWNVLSNAVKFTPEDGAIDISLGIVDGRVRLAVADSGIGMRPEFVPFVFERFSQADASLARQHHGLGIGLAIAKDIVELHGGTITATSPGVDQGSTFTISLPHHTAADRTEEDAAATAHADTPPDDAVSGVRVLVVDHDTDVSDALAATLGRFGAEVMACGSARVALEAVQTWRPDVLLADIGTEDVSGYDLIRGVRDLPPERGGRVPAAAIAENASVRDRVKAFSAGFRAHIAKPVDTAELVAIVASLAERPRAVGK